MNEWGWDSDWRTVSLNGSNGSGNDNDNDNDDDEDDYVPSNKSSSSGSSKAQSQAESTEGAGDVYEVIRLINVERREAGLPELTIDSELMEMAAVRTKETALLRGHDRPDGRNFDSILTDFGRELAKYYTAENISYGRITASEVANVWMNSFAHKANILKSTVSRIGVAYYYDKNSEHKQYWVMLATS